MRNRAYILILVFLLSLSVPILSSSEQIVVEDIEENILPNWDYDEYKESETSVAVLGDVMVSCEKDFSPKKLSVRNYSGEILWEKNIDCQYLEVSNTGDYFVVLSIFHDGEVNWYSMQVYSVLSSEELWTYDFEWGNQPYVGISGNGHFITAVTANSGLFYFSKASNQSLWESSPLSDYQEREVTSMGHSFMGMSMSYDITTRISINL